MRKKIAVLIGLVLGLLLLMGVPAFATDTNVDVTAVVTKIPGNTNLLTITLTDDTGVFTEEFSIRNNAKGSYPVGDYSVFVSTYGNDKIDQCYVQEVALNLNTMDLTMPFSEEFNVIDEDGNPVLIELSFEPASLSRGSGSTTGSASVGRYTTRAKSAYVEILYSFDVYLHGTSQWEISRKSDLFYGGYFVTFSNPRTTIIRSVCTGTYPAEIHGLVNAAFFTNQWTGPIASKSIFAYTTIAYTGKLTIVYGV